MFWFAFLQQSEEPLPNAHAIEALWPSPPKHSSNIPSPDSSYLQDILVSSKAEQKKNKRKKGKVKLGKGRERKMEGRAERG